VSYRFTIRERTITIPGFTVWIPAFRDILLVALIGYNLAQFRGCSIPWPAPGPAPIPGPPVPPDPTPTPTPITGRIWLTLVVPDESSPKVAALRTSPAIRQACNEHQVAFLSYLEREEDVDRQNLRPFVTSLGLPVMVAQNDAGRVLAKVRASDEASVIQLIRDLRSGVYPSPQ
jgi:hypothetical protein